MKFLRDATPLTQIIFTLILILTGGILVSLIGFLGIWMVLGISFDAITGMLNNLSDPANLPLLKFFQILQTIGMFILPPLVLANSLEDKPMQYLQLDRKPSWMILVVVCAVILVGGPLIEWCSMLNQQLVLPSWMSSLENWMRSSEDQAAEITKAFLSTKSIGGLIGNLLIVAVLPAIGEELLFRGLLQKMIKKITGSMHWGIWITAILFSALHLQFFGFLPRMLLGALFGYLLEWTGSLWIPVIAHFINNAMGVVTYFFTGEGLEPEQPDVPLFSSPAFFWAIASGIAIWLLLKYIYSKKVTYNASEIQI